MTKSKTQSSALTVETRVEIPIALPDGTEPNKAEFATFAGVPGNVDHTALIFAPQSETPLVRIHSECLTGDVFHSLRCDCRAQLEETVAQMSKAGGILIYLRQEGRGIGLANKLAAYKLQDEGLDTYEANRKLGLEEDARDFTIAADILRALEVDGVRLITNNPNKASALTDAGIEIIEIIPTRRHVTPFNKKYLDTKAGAGHKFSQ